jgi:hypothetical protein
MLDARSPPHLESLLPAKIEGRRGFVSQAVPRFFNAVGDVDFGVALRIDQKRSVALALKFAGAHEKRTDWRLLRSDFHGVGRVAVLRG